MGLSQSQDRIWLRVGRGSFLLIADEGTEGAKMYKKLDGTPFWAVPYNTLTGYLEAIERRTNKFDNEELVFIVRDDEDADKRYAFSLPTSSRNTKGLIAQLRSADLTQPITFVAYPQEYEGKTITRMLVKQGGNVLPWHYLSSANPKAHTLPKDRVLPPPRPVTVNGKRTFDYTDQLAFINKQVDAIISELRGAIVDPQPGEASDDADVFTVSKTPADSTPADSDDLDDLPF